MSSALEAATRENDVYEANESDNTVLLSRWYGEPFMRLWEHVRANR